ncbi:MAG: urease accessory protein UreD, partial [Sneathiella sp.]
YDNARLDRELTVDLAENARFLAVEAVLLGRLAMGERLNHFSMRDRWNIRRGGRLVHAEALHFKESSDNLVQRRAVLDGHVAFATLCYTSPDQDELSALAVVFQEMLVGSEGGVSTFNGKLLVRLTAPDGLKLRKNLIPLIQKLRNNDPMPKVWMS